VEDLVKSKPYQIVLNIHFYFLDILFAYHVDLLALHFFKHIYYLISDKIKNDI